MYLLKFFLFGRARQDSGLDRVLLIKLDFYDTLKHFYRKNPVSRDLYCHWTCGNILSFKARIKKGRCHVVALMCSLKQTVCIISLHGEIWIVIWSIFDRYLASIYLESHGLGLKIWAQPLHYSRNISSETNAISMYLCCKLTFDGGREDLKRGMVMWWCEDELRAPLRIEWMIWISRLTLSCFWNAGIMVASDQS